jgi:DnaK suppressor protein
VTSKKAVKTAKPAVKKVVKKTVRPAKVAAKKPAAKAKAGTSIKPSTKASAKDAAPKAAAKPVKPNRVNVLAPKPQARKTSAAKPTATSSATRPTAKPVALAHKAVAARAHGKVAAAPHVASATYHPVQVPARSAAGVRPVVIKKDPRLADNWKLKPVEEWTDAEVICMPDEEYMNDKQLAFFRLRLLQLKNDILNNAGETTEHLRSDTVVVPDPADRATIEEEHALELRTRDRERKLLRKIEQSIARIDAGDYGYCDETGEPIGVPRLLARPTATLSLEAQQRRELKQKLFGD